VIHSPAGAAGSGNANGTSPTLANHVAGNNRSGRRAERLDLYSRPVRRKEDRGRKGLQSSWISLGIRHQVFNVERSITLC